LHNGTLHQAEGPHSQHLLLSLTSKEAQAQEISSCSPIMEDPANLACWVTMNPYEIYRVDGPA
jgi:hypothetical protein